MAEFKCISCGATKDSKSPCNCPTCGYRMFASPYDRAEILRKEILRFITQLKLTDIDVRSLDIFRREPQKPAGADKDEYTVIPKSHDDQRFPAFEKIRDYVCSSNKTEKFCERLNESIEQIGEYIHTSYRQEYLVSADSIRSEISHLDEVLSAALAELGTRVALPDIELPEIHLDYSETPDEKLLTAADAILEDLTLLTEKIRKFIRYNNIYGTAYQDTPKTSLILSGDTDPLAFMQKYASRVSKVLAKKYTVDIFSDGSDELAEMLGALWNAIKAIMLVPIFIKKYTYTFSDGVIAINEGIREELLGRVEKRYTELDSVIYAFDFLSGLTEERLFDLYNKMIGLDTDGILGVDKNDLITIGESEKKLSELIGLSGIKESIKKIKAYALSNRGSSDLNIHMCFLGNPGSGKTEVARYVAGILFENKILPTKKIVEVDRSGLVSQYFGATAEKTKHVIESAMGGVLFIDEAYALGNNADTTGITDYGKEAIDTLVKAMEDNRGKFCVILAGYKNEMLRMLSTNPGFKSRIQFILDFPNYSRDELRSITELMLKSRKYTISDAAMCRILDITDIRRKEPNFANAREIRNILDQVIMCQNIRCMGTNDQELGLVDVNRYITDAKINLPTTSGDPQARVLSGEEELDSLIGLDAVKRMIRKIKAYAKRNKGEAGFNLHMCFYGNPGTGKTEVARILSRILYDAGVLDEAKLVETDGQGLIGKFVGETAPKTEAKINEAMNGVLFIDEAYSLVSSGRSGANSSNYGDEAIAVLLKEMEDHRGQFCVILAGYKDEMKELLSANPGFESRIQFTLDFPDYTREELGEIAKIFLRKKKYEIEEPALELLLNVTDYFRKLPNFANARTVRNILDQVLMNQNLRTEDHEDDNTVIAEDVEDYLSDEGIDLSKPDTGRGHIGF